MENSVEKEYLETNYFVMILESDYTLFVIALLIIIALAYLLYDFKKERDKKQSQNNDENEVVKQNSNDEPSLVIDGIDDISEKRRKALNKTIENAGNLVDYGMTKGEKAGAVLVNAIERNGGYENNGILLEDNQLAILEEHVSEKLGVGKNYLSRVTEDGKLIMPLDILPYLNKSLKPFITSAGDLIVRNLIPIEATLAISIQYKVPLYFWDNKLKVIKKVEFEDINKYVKTQENLEKTIEWENLENEKNKALDELTFLRKEFNNKIDESKNLEKTNIELERKLLNLQKDIEKKDIEINLLKEQNLAFASTHSMVGNVSSEKPLNSQKDLTSKETKKDTVNNSNKNQDATSNKADKVEKKKEKKDDVANSNKNQGTTSNNTNEVESKKEKKDDVANSNKNQGTTSNNTNEVESKKEKKYDVTNSNKIQNNSSETSDKTDKNEITVKQSESDEINSNVSDGIRNFDPSSNVLNLISGKNNISSTNKQVEEEKTDKTLLENSIENKPKNQQDITDESKTHNTNNKELTNQHQHTENNTSIQEQRVSTSNDNNEKNGSPKTVFDINVVDGISEENTSEKKKPIYRRSSDQKIIRGLLSNHFLTVDSIKETEIISEQFYFGYKKLNKGKFEVYVNLVLLENKIAKYLTENYDIKKDALRDVLGNIQSQIVSQKLNLFTGNEEYLFRVFMAKVIVSQDEIYGIKNFDKYFTPISKLDIEKNVENNIDRSKWEAVLNDINEGNFLPVQSKRSY